MLRLNSKGNRNVKKRYSYFGTHVTFEQISPNKWEPLDGHYTKLKTWGSTFPYRLLVHNADPEPTNEMACYGHGGFQHSHGHYNEELILLHQLHPERTRQYVVAKSIEKMKNKNSIPHL